MSNTNNVDDKTPVADGEEEQDLTVFDSAESKKPIDPIGTDMGHAEAFNIDELNAFLLERNACVIAIIGEYHSGKTTIPTSLYGFLKEGAFGSLEFSESRTLLGFERRFHTLTVDSGRATAETPRTSKLNDLQFLHLELVETESSFRRDLFFSDRAGEYFTQLRSGELNHQDLKEISKADVLAFIIDGENISNPKWSSNVYANVRQTLRTLVQEKAIPKNTSVQLITTKWDLIEHAKGTKAIVKRLMKFEKEIKEQYVDELPNLSCKRIAAQGVEVDSDEHTKFQNLVRDWVCTNKVKNEATTVQINAESEFERMLERVGSIE